METKQRRPLVESLCLPSRIEAVVYLSRWAGKKVMGLAPPDRDAQLQSTLADNGDTEAWGTRMQEQHAQSCSWIPVPTGEESAMRRWRFGCRVHLKAKASLSGQKAFT